MWHGEVLKCTLLFMSSCGAVCRNGSSRRTVDFFCGNRRRVRHLLPLPAFRDVVSSALGGKLERRNKEGSHAASGPFATAAAAEGGVARLRSRVCLVPVRDRGGGALPGRACTCVGGGGLLGRARTCVACACMCSGMRMRGCIGGRGRPRPRARGRWGRSGVRSRAVSTVPGLSQCRRRRAAERVR